DPPGEQLAVAGGLERAAADGRAAGAAPQVEGFARRSADTLVEAAFTGVRTPHHDTRRVDRLVGHLGRSLLWPGRYPRRASRYPPWLWSRAPQQTKGRHAGDEHRLFRAPIRVTVGGIDIVAAD